MSGTRGEQGSTALLMCEGELLSDAGQRPVEVMISMVIGGEQLWPWAVAPHCPNTLQCRALSSIRALVLHSFSPVATFLSSCEVSNLHADYCLMSDKDPWSILLYIVCGWRCMHAPSYVVTFQ